MNARLLLVAAAAAGLPCLSTMAAAQSDRSAREDSTQSSLPGGIPSFSMFGFGRGGAAGAATVWQCVGVCTPSRALSVLGSPVADGVNVPSRGRGDDVAAAGRGRDVAKANGAANRGRDAERGRAGDDEMIANDDVEGGTSSWRDASATAARGGAARDDGEYEGESDGGTSASAALPQGAGGYAPALLAGAAVGAGAIWAANQGGNNTPHSPVTSSVVVKPPTLTMANPPAPGETANQTATVPEPGSLALVVTGLAALGLRRRRAR